MVFTDYKGMNVEDMMIFRSRLKEASLEYRVVKNTLARIASKDTDVELASAIFKGPIGIAISYDDPILVVKKVLDFAKDNEKIQVKGAVVEGKFCEESEAKQIAELPPRDVLLSMCAGVLQAPLSKMAAALAATVSRFAYALEAARAKREG